MTTPVEFLTMTTAPETLTALRATTKPAPQILQSADEAPCGSLCVVLGHPERVVMRLSTTHGRNMGKTANDTFDGEGWAWTRRASFDFPARLIAEGLTEAECRHLSGLSAQEAIAWCERRADQAAQASKPRPQPGDVVPWTEVEAGCLYFRSDDSYHPFRVVVAGPYGLIMSGPDDHDLPGLLTTPARGATVAQIVRFENGNPNGVLVARDLGTDPEAWRRAMREWTANGNKPAPKPEPSEPERRGVKRIVDPLRQPGVLSRGGCSEVTPERVVALALERIETDRREIERLRAATAEARKALETPGRQGLRARLAKAEAAVAELPKTPSWARVKIASLEAEAVTRRAEIESARAEVSRLRKERDEARAGWAEQTGDAARLRLELQKAQQQIVQAHEDIDTLIAKQTAAERELLKTQSEGTHRSRLLAQLLDEIARGYFVDRFLDPTLYANVMKAAGREVKP